ncbi:MAG: cation:dicarboxylase symporter family transporter [Deltaproteobacteria bacterium]|nr:cation:dicarboxylase symporter family transporter [Deltaproteobacteria bacterium]MBW2419072.1 cation:dicarboxylase symporter family transporter [Deltaproteobacteria bacterium]
MSEGGASRLPPSLGAQILVGLVSGISLGLTVGEYAAPLKIVGDLFVGLLQMTVLPYIVATLLANVGRLSLVKGRRLITWAIVVWAVLVALGASSLVAMSLAFPDRSTPSFFSAGMAEGRAHFDFLALFVPANIFRSLVDNAIPGVVLFCLFVGAALSGMAEKENALRGLDAVAEVIARVNAFVIQLMPFGVFAIGAAAAGTMTVEEFGRLRGYLLVFTLSSAVLSFWILPALVAATTPFTYREIFRASRAALLTAFATGKVLVVLPMLVESTRAMFEEKGLEDGDTGPSIDVLYPLIYPFPTLGKLIALLFIPFTAAFVGRALDLWDYPGLMAQGTLSLFGGPILTIPFLLESHQLPADMFQLFLVSGVVTSRLGDILGVMNLVAFTVITTCALTGSLRLRWHALTVALGVGALLIAVASGGSRVWLELRKGDYSRDAVVAGMHIMDAAILVDAAILEAPSPNPVPLAEGASRLERIRERGALRVGFNDDNLPYAFRNGRGDLVGLDIEMAHRLASDLGVSLELVPFERETLARQIEKDHFDIAMSGLIGTIERSQRMRLSRPYLQATLSLVVADHHARALDTYSEIVEVELLRIGILTESQFAKELRVRLPAAETVLVPSTQWFFDGAHDLDGLLLSAEAGAAWTMLHPSYQVVVPMPRRVSMPLVYAMPARDGEFAVFVDTWISLQQGMGRVDGLYEYWILGEGTETVEPRWSILRNVLQLVE